MSIVAEIAQAVVDTINAASLSQPVTAERHYQPIFDLADLRTLKVSVVPKSVKLSAANRALQVREYQVDVGVQKKLGQVDAAHMDPLIELVDEIAALFKFKRLPGYEPAVWMKSEVDPLYAQEHLQQYRQFTSVLTLTFKVAV